MPFNFRIPFTRLLTAAFFSLPLLLFAQTDEDCLACHSDPELSKTRGTLKISLYTDGKALAGSAHAGLTCVECHGKLNPDNTPHAKVIKAVSCQGCHDVGGYDKSVHGRLVAAQVGKPKAADAGCKECHGTHAILSPTDPKSSTRPEALSATCGKCHADVANHYLKSAHGMALSAGTPSAPSCTHCHGEHNVEPVKSRDSHMFKTREAEVCLKCHLDNPDVRKKVGPGAGFIKSYETSVHGLSLARGNEKAPTCSDCHGAHDMHKGNDAASLTGRAHVAATCGKCHAEIAATFNSSIHGTALEKGISEAPTCTDCHGEHQIISPKDPASRVASQNVSAQVCAGCHSSLKLSAKYGVAAERFKTFSDSYHGLALKGGSMAVANCASCHGVHNIRPSSDTASTIAPAHLAATCGTCHPGADKNFTKGAVHVEIARDNNAILYWIRLFYLFFIVATIGGMLAHNGLDLFRKLRIRMAQREGRLSAPHHGTRQYERITLNERVQHALFFTSFILLVITGFMLKFPDAWWVAPIRQISERAFDVRSLVHRIAAAIMVLTSLYHIGYLLLTVKGKKLLRDMRPRFQDARDAVGMLLYNTGLSKTKPQFDRFGYIEKAEYWALVWGTVVMSVSGVIMWFDNHFIRLFTKLGWDVARTVHYYEAWLATLAIIVWHFYFIIFNPDVYPMNTAWLTGKVSEDLMMEDHSLQLARIKAEDFKRLEEEPKKS